MQQRLDAADRLVPYDAADRADDRLTGLYRHRRGGLSDPGRRCVPQDLARYGPNRHPAAARRNDAGPDGRVHRRPDAEFETVPAARRGHGAGQTRSTVVKTMEEVDKFFAQMARATETGAGATITLSEFVEAIGDRWKRGLDPTSTAQGYDAGLRLRVLAALGREDHAGDDRPRDRRLGNALFRLDPQELDRPTRAGARRDGTRRRDLREPGDEQGTSEPEHQRSSDDRLTTPTRSPTSTPSTSSPTQCSLRSWQSAGRRSLGSE